MGLPVGVVDARGTNGLMSDQGADGAVVVRPRFVLGVVTWVIAGLVTLLVLDRSRHVLALVVVAVVLAVLVRGPVDALSRNVPRWAAITIVVLGTIGSVAGIMALGTIELNQQLDSVNTAVTNRIEHVDPESSLGEFLAEGRVAERISDHLDNLPSNVLVGSADAAAGAQLVVEALLVVVLAIYALVNGPRLVRPLLGSEHRWWAVPVRRGVAEGASQVRRLLLVAVASGFVGFLVSTVLGLPGSVVLAIWVGVWATVPILGPSWVRADDRAGVVGRLAADLVRGRSRRRRCLRELVRRPPRLRPLAGWRARAYRPVRARRGARDRSPVRLADRTAGGRVPDSRHGVDSGGLGGGARPGRVKSPRCDRSRRCRVGGGSSCGEVGDDLAAARLAIGFDRHGVGRGHRCCDRTPDRHLAGAGVATDRRHAVDRPRPTGRLDRTAHQARARGRGSRSSSSACSPSWRRCSCSPCPRWPTAFATSTTNSRRSAPISKACR